MGRISLSAVNYALIPAAVSLPASIVSGTQKATIRIILSSTDLSAHASHSSYGSSLIRPMPEMIKKLYFNKLSQRCFAAQIFAYLYLISAGLACELSAGRCENAAA